MPPFDLKLFLLGCVGGVIPDLLRIAKSRHDAAMPAYLKSIYFYIGLLVQIAIGGFAAWMLGAAELKQAIMFGFSGPELLTKAFAAIRGDAGEVTAMDRGEIRALEWLAR